jgi:enhancer of yellow 2 transcription factor
VNRPPTPDDTAEEEEKQPTLHETINIKVLLS